MKRGVPRWIAVMLLILTVGCASPPERAVLVNTGPFVDEELVLQPDGHLSYRCGRMNKADGTWTRLGRDVIKAEVRYYRGQRREYGFEGDQIWDAGADDAWYLWLGTDSFVIFRDTETADRYAKFKRAGDRTKAELAGERNVYEIRGEVRMPGSYEFTPGVTVSDAIRSAGGQTPWTYPTAKLIREETVRKINIRSILKGEAPDVELERGDVLVVLRIA